MRPALAAVAFAAAVLGVGASLAVARLAGWTGSGGTRTVVVSAPAPVTTTSTTTPAAAPLPAGSFDPARIYTERSGGVVTIYATFAGGQEQSQGSGFVVSRGGVILTNSHVITNVATGSATPADSLAVQFSDLDRVPATIVGWDVFDDVGVIRIDPKAHALAPVPLGNSAGVAVGDPVAVIGSPFGKENSLTVGIVSATRRSIESLTSSYDLPDAIQTDAAINHGNSGGPLFDARGRVIGITAQIRSDTGAAEGVGFAVPIDAARRSLRELLAGGSVHYAYVGITTESLVPSVAHRFHFGVDRGAIVTGVKPGSPAAGAGFRPATRQATFAGAAVSTNGDVVVAIDGLPVGSADDLVRIVSERLRPGRFATFSVVRGSSRRTIAIRLGRRG